MEQIGCSTFSFSTMNNSKPNYWAERWELYKQRYAVSRWTWVRGITDIEFWNEPDLIQPCMNNTLWLEMYVLSSTAIQDAYTDLNNDYSKNRITCPLINGISCPIQPNIIASAFAHLTFDGPGNFGNITVSNEHLTFPPYKNVLQLSPIWSIWGISGIICIQSLFTGEQCPRSNAW